MIRSIDMRTYAVFLGLALWVASASSSAQEQMSSPPPGALTVGLRETARHRPRLAPVRSVSLEDFSLTSGALLWLHVDPQGHVIEVRLPEGQKPLSPEVRAAARNIHYVPFTRGGNATDAWVQEEIPLLPRIQEPERKREIPFPPVSEPTAVTIELSRSGCFGTCPAYAVTIRGDGMVTYRGDGFVSISGKQVAQIDSGAVSALLDQFRAGDFLALQDEYRAGWTDQSTFRLTLKMGDVSKVVSDYVGEWAGMPAVVTDLEEAVDRVSDSARWVTTSAATLQAMKEAGIGLRTSQAAQVLRRAVEVGDVVTAAKLLEAGTPVGSKGDRNCGTTDGSLLELAVQSRNAEARAEMLKILLASPAVSTDRNGKQRALALAAQQGDADLARVLIGAGADPTARFSPRYNNDERRVTYLMLAAASGGWAMLDDALNRPLEIHSVDSEGRTALEWVFWNAPPTEDVFPIVDRLLQHGAKTSELDDVLHFDCNPRWIPGIVARGGNVNARDAKGNTALFQSCPVEGVHALLKAGANPSVRNKARKTAIEAVYTSKDDKRAAVIREFIATHPLGSH